MQYEHTRAEELKELAEKEAASITEKEDNWEEERENMKVSLTIIKRQQPTKSGFFRIRKPWQEFVQY